MLLDDMPQPGSTVGPWLILDRMDSGSFGVVFRARRAGHPEGLTLYDWFGRSRTSREVLRVLQRLFAERFRKDETARWRSSPTDDLYSLGVTFYRCVTGGYLPPMSEGGPSSDGADDELLCRSESGTDEPSASSSTDSRRAGRRRRREVGVPDWLAQALVALAGGLIIALVLLLILLLG